MNGMKLLKYAELIKVLTIANLKVRYKNSILGFGWSLLNPFLLMIVFVVIFGILFRITTPEYEPFPVFLLIGIISWRFFSLGTTTALKSIVEKANLVKKIYFPREILVFSAILAIFVSTILEFIIFFIIFLAFGVEVTFLIILFPILLLLEFILVYGVGLLMSAVYVRLRDIDYIWEVCMHIGFFISPIFYGINIMPMHYLTYYLLNPMASIISIMRNSLLYGDFLKYAPNVDFFLVHFIGIPLLIIFGIFALGFVVFKKLEPNFAVEL